MYVFVEVSEKNYNFAFRNFVIYMYELREVILICDVYQ